MFFNINFTITLLIIDKKIMSVVGTIGRRFTNISKKILSKSVK